MPTDAHLGPGPGEVRARERNYPITYNTAADRSSPESSSVNSLAVRSPLHCELAFNFPERDYLGGLVQPFTIYYSLLSAA